MQEKALEIIEKDSRELLGSFQKFEGYKIESEEQLQTASEFLVSITLKFREVRDKGKDYTDPLYNLWKEAKKQVESVLSPLLAVVSDLESKVGEYKAERQKRLLLASKHSNLALPAPPSVINTSQGKLFTTHNWKYHVKDLTKVPKEYLQFSADDKKISQAIDSGVRTIKGLEIYSESKENVRRN